MTRRVIVEPGAKADINQARERYDLIRADLGKDFYDAVIEVIDRLRRNTDGSVTVPHERRARRILMKRFPFQVVFQESSKSAVHVVAVRHMSRKPISFTG